jgi:hypothetical protein
MPGQHIAVLDAPDALSNAPLTELIQQLKVRGKGAKAKLTYK